MKGTRIVQTLYFLAAGIGALSLPTRAQVYQDTLWVPVIFYDYHATRPTGQGNTSSSFENDLCNQWFGDAPNRGMVSSTIGPNNKPVTNPSFTGVFPGFSTMPTVCFQPISNWFYPSGNAGRSTTAQWVYTPVDTSWTWNGLTNYQGRPNEWVASDFNASYALANVVIYDSLPFRLTDATRGIYQYQNGEFFMLDNKGFGNEPAGQNPMHNFGFTMELHRIFTYRTGMTFSFEGDDDVWVFINGRLVMDLGGVHGMVGNSFNLDNLASSLGLKIDSTYNFDFFYCERHTTASDIKVTTNIITAIPIDALLLSVGDDTIQAGATLTIESYLKNKQNQIVKTDSSVYNLVNWQILNTTAYPKMPGDTFYFPTPKVNNQKIIASGTRAYRSFQIRAFFIDPTTNQLVDDTATIYITPGPPYRITVEDTRTPNLYVPASRQSILISSARNTDTLSYAYLRDRYNNLIAASSGRAMAAQWQISPAADISFATVAPATGEIWHGIVSRVARNNGTTSMIVSQTGVPVPDTVPITISGVTITRIRVVDTTGFVVTTINMTTDDHKYLKVQGLPSNAPNDSAKYWIDAVGKFTLNNLFSDPDPSQNFVASYTFNPTRPGTGTIVVYSNETGVAEYTIQVTVAPAPRTFVLVPQTDTVAADSSITIAATVRNGAGALRPDLATLTTWALVNADATQAGDQLLATSGDKTVLAANKAYRTVLVEGTYIDPETGAILRDTASIFISPGAPYKLWIENTATPNLNLPSKRTIVFLPSTSDADSGSYAYIRDKFGNLIADGNSGRATAAQWKIINTADEAFARIAGAAGKLWQGVVARQNDSSGTTKGIAWQVWGTQTLVPDTVDINMSNITITKIVVVDVDADTIVTSINMTTDQSIPLKVMGKPSNVTSDSIQYWVDVSGLFVPPSGIQFNPAALPTAVSQWVMSPVTGGSGNLIVSYPYDASIKKDTIPLVITVAPPSRVTIDLLSSEEGARKAGVAFHAIVRIYNGDGLVPGTWCYPGQDPNKAAYQDIIMRLDQAAPFVVTPSGSGDINLRPSDGKTVSKECFANGVDTVHITLYYAPGSADSLHQIFVRLHGLNAPGGGAATIEGATARFPLLPNDVDSIVIVGSDGTPLPPTMALTAPGGSITGVVKGYDAYGNPLPNDVLSDWTNGNGLHPVQPAQSTMLFYTSRDVQYGESGCIIAAAHDNPAAKDSICITITAPPATYSVVTRDTSGNGFLDRIDLHFNKRVTLTDADIAALQIIYQKSGTTATFSIADIRSASGDAQDSVYYIALTEYKKGDTLVPQTAWLPTVTITGISGITSEPPDPSNLYDGAPPVVWSVVEEVKSGTATITVNFSEELLHFDGSSLNQASDSLKRILNVWRQNSDGSFTFDPAALDSAKIISIKTVSTDEPGVIRGNVRHTQIVFTLPDSLKLQNDHYLNIVTITDSSVITRQIVDNITSFLNPGSALKGNVPQVNNIKRKTIVIQKDIFVTQGPNPFPPSLSYQEQQLALHDQQTIAQKVVEDRIGGTIISIEVTPQTTPALGQLTVTDIGAVFKVYDIAGNLVYNRDNAHMLTTDNDWDDKAANQNWKSGESKKIAFWWGGYNDAKRACAPGVYKGIVYLTLYLKDARNGAVTQKLAPKSIIMGVRR